MTHEFQALTEKINAIRDLIGPELPVPEDLPDLPDRLLSTDEAAEILGCTVRNIRFMYAQGKLTKMKRVGKSVLLDRDEVMEYATSRHERRPEVSRLTAS